VGGKEGKRIEPLSYHGQLYLILYPILYPIKDINPLPLKTLTYYPGWIAGIEPASYPWQREILPFNYIRLFLIYNVWTLFVQS
jgi:hypothetical protein